MNLTFSTHLKLLKKIKESGKPVAVILVTGRPLIITPYLDDWDALIAAWLPGTEGEGVTDVLFGDYKPTGKLSKEDERKLCLALTPISNPETRYKHKDHSIYYCTLILNRDSQAYCYGVVLGDPKKCDNIVSKGLEKECLVKSQ